MSRVVVAMSGGVDSSVAAWLLRRAGHDVVGLFMRHGPQGEATHKAAGRQQGCCSAADAEDARRVAQRLDIPFYVLNFQEEFARIIAYFVAEYTAGRTPNPCIACNTWLKFGKLLEFADGMGAQQIATGHYARLVPAADGQLALCRGVDGGKDQSYVLWGVERRVLSRLSFPVGQYQKGEVRQMAAELGLDVADKPDSQEICFVPAGQHARFVRQFPGAVDTAGEIVTTAGAVVGRHQGLEGFTVGQRKGLGIAFGEPRYVVRLEPATRRVVVGTKQELARGELTASGANWLASPPHRCEVKIRYRSGAVAASVDLLPGDRFAIHFDEPCLGVAPGQAAVCYAGDRLLGGGWIDGP
ncbi:MAG: tRNA 2-thiouridine(34) synthase MnmA [Thermoguttaceae bacterium]